MPNIGPWEIILLLFLALLLFGAKRLPEIGRSVGESMREFKKSIRDQTEDVRTSAAEVRAEVAEVRHSATGTAHDIRSELSDPLADTVAAVPMAPKEHTLA